MIHFNAHMANFSIEDCGSFSTSVCVMGGGVGGRAEKSKDGSTLQQQLHCWTIVRILSSYSRNNKCRTAILITIPALQVSKRKVEEGPSQNDTHLSKKAAQALGSEARLPGSRTSLVLIQWCLGKKRCATFSSFSQIQIFCSPALGDLNKEQLSEGEMPMTCQDSMGLTSTFLMPFPRFSYLIVSNKLCSWEEVGKMATNITNVETPQLPCVF